MTKAELVSAVALTTGYSKKEILEIVEASMETVKATVSGGEAVFLRGFGTFSTKRRAQKLARNIKANTALIVPAHDIPSFKPAKEYVESLKK